MEDQKTTLHAIMHVPGKQIEGDERLAQVLDDISHKRVDVDTACRENPELAEELRHLLALGQMVDFCVQEGHEATLAHDDSGPSDSQDPPKCRDTLPRSFGDYELVEELGRGGMGVVYKAWDKKLERFVALKMVLRGQLASAADLERFRREAQAAAGLAHPHIVPVYQVGEHDGQAYFCMKYIEGLPLTAVVAGGPLAPRLAASYMACIARAVQHAHDKGILHRDLKPANIILEISAAPARADAASAPADPHTLQTAIPRITDFGLAKRVAPSTSQDEVSGTGASLTGTGAILGTPSYMAPEQAEGSRPMGSGAEVGRGLGPAADVYSLGAILYELLTGRPPFLAASVVETLLLVRSEEPVRPRLLNPQIDLDLEFICRKCLEKRPEHRYQSANALADDLEAFLRGDQVSARSSSLVYFVSRLFRETHLASVQENWGLLWILHSAALMVLCAVTSGLYAADVRSHGAFLALWSIGLVAWAALFWQLRRRAGPVTFVERQIAHAWGAGVAASIGMFIVEVMLSLDVLRLTPVLPVIAGMVFVVMAGTLAGWFYIAAIISFLAALPMALIGLPWSPLLFGAVSALGFLVPGLKYYRQTRATRQP
jgi:serine/threonine-protein kinase